MPESPDIDQIAPELLSRLPGIQAIYLFGSRANGAPHAGSDLDIAVLADVGHAEVALWETAQALASRLGVDVDLVDLGAVSTVMQMQIINGTRRLYCRNEQRCEEFEDRVFSAYARLNEERAEILRDIENRGNVHG